MRGEGGVCQCVCQVGSWFSTGASRIARVNCFKPSGAWIDATFVFEYAARVQ